MELLGSDDMLDNIKTIFDIIGTTATTLAIIVGGWWAYFKLVQGRTFRPRLEVDMSELWHEIGGSYRAHARVSVKNIGSSDVNLLQRGTGLRISTLTSEQIPGPSIMRWTSLGVFEIFKEHDWIEPGETISDELLLDLGHPGALLFEVRLVWQWQTTRRAKIRSLTSIILHRNPLRSDDAANIVVSARQIFPLNLGHDACDPTERNQHHDRPQRATERQQGYFPK
jgi:hypothetical protein